MFKARYQKRTVQVGRAGVKKNVIKENTTPESGFFLRKLLGTRYGPVGTRFL